MQLNRYLTPSIWLIVPIMALHIAFAGNLPAPFQPEIFRADIPAGLTLMENSLRIALFTLMTLLPLRARRTGWAVCLAGSGLYSASPAIGFTAPGLKPWH